MAISVKQESRGFSHVRFKYMPNTEEKDYITSIIKNYKVAILILEDVIK